jgi:hypothetical protein
MSDVSVKANQVEDRDFTLYLPNAAPHALNEAAK